MSNEVPDARAFKAGLGRRSLCGRQMLSKYVIWKAVKMKNDVQ